MVQVLINKLAQKNVLVTVFALIISIYLLFQVEQKNVIFIIRLTDVNCKNKNLVRLYSETISIVRMYLALFLLHLHLLVK